jgi:hypothetical protein
MTTAVEWREVLTQRVSELFGAARAATDHAAIDAAADALARLEAIRMPCRAIVELEDTGEPCPPP